MRIVVAVFDTEWFSETSIVSFLVVSMMIVVQLRRIATKPLSDESQLLILIVTLRMC